MVIKNIFLILVLLQAASFIAVEKKQGLSQKRNLNDKKSSTFYSIIKKDILVVIGALACYGAAVHADLIYPFTRISVIRQKVEDYLTPIICSYIVPFPSYISQELGIFDDVICNGCEKPHNKNGHVLWRIYQCSTQKKSLLFCPDCTKEKGSCCKENDICKKKIWEIPVCGICKEKKILKNNNLIKEHNCPMGGKQVVCKDCLTKVHKVRSDGYNEQLQNREELIYEKVEVNCPFCCDGNVRIQNPKSKKKNK